MALVLILLTVLLFLSTNGLQTYRDKRANCVDPWVNIPSPCLGNKQKKIYFPHPNDQSKFIQCDMLGRMYIIQCPSGESYDPTTSSCSTGVVQPVVTTPSAQTTRTTIPTTTQAPNPCTISNVAQGLIYHPYPKDPSKFLQCDNQGNALLGSCNTGTIWNQQRLACVYNIQPGGQSTTPPSTTASVPGKTTTTTPSGTTKSMCNAKVSGTDELFHPHPDPHKFYQCDLWGDMYESDCPPTLVWNDFSKTCSSPYGAIG